MIRAIAACLLVALAPPRAAQPIPRSPGRLAEALAQTTLSLRDEVDRWRTAGGRGRAPAAVELTALYQQRIYRLLARDERLAAAVLPRLPRDLRSEARADVAAGRDLLRLAPPPTTRHYRVGPPLPAATLRRFYREAERRFGVRWDVLAAVNFVESRFGRVRSSSVAGAPGPMQFLPATWRRYGLGGDVNDPRDAILGAANYLRANGAPRDYRRALYAYNHSRLYVDAILRYAGRIRSDHRAYFEYYAWQVFVRTPTGDRRLTGPGLARG